MKTTNDIFKGSDASLTEVPILAVGSWGAGSYSLPAGDLWTNYESVEIALTSDGNPERIYNSVTISKEFINSNPTDFVAQIRYATASGGVPGRADIIATSSNTFNIGVYSTTYLDSTRVAYVKAYKKKYTTRNLSKVVYVNGGSNIAVNSRYEIDIATMLGSEYLNRDLVVVAEIYNNSGTGVADWGTTPWTYITSTSVTGVDAVVVGNKIVVQTARNQLMTTSNVAGGGLNLPGGVIITSAPCRIKVWKVDEYLPATRSSGDITTIWTGSAGAAVTVDWSGTGYVLSQFDAILLEATTNAGQKGDTLTITPQALLGTTPNFIVGLNSIGTSYSRVEVTAVTETSLTVSLTQATFAAGTLVGIYGINYK